MKNLKSYIGKKAKLFNNDIVTIDKIREVKDNYFVVEYKTDKYKNCVINADLVFTEDKKHKLLEQ